MEEKQAKNKSWLSSMAAKLIKGTKEIFEDKELKRWQEKGNWKEVGDNLVEAYRPFQEEAQKIAQERGSFNDKEYKNLINLIQNHPLQNEYQIEVGHDTRGGWLKVTYTNPEGASREIKVEADGDRAKELGITYKMGDKPLYLPPKTFYLRPTKDGGITKLTEAEREKENREKENREKEIKQDRRAVKAVKAMKAMKAIKPMNSVVFFNTRGESVKKETQIEGKIKTCNDQLIMEISSDNKNEVVRVLLDKKHEKMLGIDDGNRAQMGGKTVSFTVKPGGKVSVNANITTAENKSTVSQVKNFNKGR